MGNFLKNESGNVGLAFGLIASVIVYGVGMALDVSRAESQRLSMQDALDAAALYAVQNRDDDDFAINSQKFFNVNVDGNKILTSTSAFTLQAPNGGNPGSITGVARGSVPLLFGRVLGRPNLDISAESTVTFDNAPGEAICLYARDFIRINGQGRIAAPECGATSAGGLSIDSRNVDLTGICVANRNITNNARGPVPIETECDPGPVPYAGEFPEVTDLTCDFNSKNYDANVVNLAPGVYCGNHNFNRSDATINFTGGEEPYVIRGNWNIQGRWLGDEVAFYFANNNARFNFNSGFSAVLRPPLSGPYQGVFMTDGPNVTNGGDMNINDTGQGFDYEGVIYLPSRRVQLNGDATLTTRSLAIVARQLGFDGSLRADPPKRLPQGTKGGTGGAIVYISD